MATTQQESAEYTVQFVQSETWTLEAIQNMILTYFPNAKLLLPFDHDRPFIRTLGWNEIGHESPMTTSSGIHDVITVIRDGDGRVFVHVLGPRTSAFVSSIRMDLERAILHGRATFDMTLATNSKICFNLQDTETCLKRLLDFLSAVDRLSKQYDKMLETAKKMQDEVNAVDKQIGEFEAQRFALKQQQKEYAEKCSYKFAKTLEIFEESAE